MKGGAEENCTRNQMRGRRRFIDSKPVMDDGCAFEGKSKRIDGQKARTWNPTLRLIHHNVGKESGGISAEARNQTNQERKVVLVHVGKAGGMTIRYSLAMECQTNAISDQRKQNKRKCQNVYNSGQKLGLQTHSVFHMWDKNDTAMEEATTFVITLRNPIERVISSYRYSHPENCIVSKDPRVRIPPSRGCVTINSGLLERKSQMGYILFKECFPSAGIEDFAQSMIMPWRKSTTNLLQTFQTPTTDSIVIPWMKSTANLQTFQNLTDSEKSLCRRMARRLVQGHKMQRIIPHMQLNYEYYATESLWKYPGKEVFAIRTENAWVDMVQIDRWIGGSGKFQKQGKQYSHGSEYYKPSPVSTEAYHKLCCILEKEIDIYFQLFDMAINLDANSKKAAEGELREKCGLATAATTTTTSWAEWRTQCQERIAATQLAENLLRPHSVRTLAEAVVYQDDNNATKLSR